MTRAWNEERLLAYVDGELDAAGRAEVEALLGRDAEAAAFVQAQQALRSQLSAAFDPVLDEPVPDALRRAVSDPPAVPKELERTEAPMGVPGAAPGRRIAANAAWWAGMAASLLFGVLLGTVLPGERSTSSLVAARDDGRWMAQDTLADALERRPGARSANADPVRVGWTYRDREGRFCRTFELTAGAVAGAACRAEDGWQVQVIAQHTGATPGTAGESGTYRQASTALPPGVLQTVDAQIDGRPLDAEAEARALQGGWKR